MQTFTIGELEHLSGVKAHTIRVWEQRYGLLTPMRKEGNHRLYTNEDLKKLLRVAYLVGLGHRISSVARLSAEAVVALALEPGVAEGATKNNLRDNVVNQLVEAMIDYDGERFDKILYHSILHLGMEKAVLTVIYPFFNKTGKLWMTDHILPANEHFASHLIRRKMIVAIDGLPQAAIPIDGLPQAAIPIDGLPQAAIPSPTAAASPGTTAFPRAPQVLLFTPLGEHHEIPLLLSHYLLKKNGKSTAYMGSNVPLQALDDYLSEKSPPYLQLNMLTRMADQSADQYISELLNRFPLQTIVFSGVQVFSVTLSHPRLLLITSLDEYFKWMAELA